MNEDKLTPEDRRAFNHYRISGVGINYQALYDRLDKLPQDQLGPWYLGVEVDHTLRSWQNVVNYGLKALNKGAQYDARSILGSVETLYRNQQVIKQQLTYLEGRDPEVEIPPDWEQLKSPISPEERQEFQICLEELSKKIEDVGHNEYGIPSGFTLGVHSR
jgi:hypothetical protein